MTGLETRDCGRAARRPRRSRSTIDGFTVTGTARVVEYRFSTDEGYLGATAAPGDAAESRGHARVRDQGRAHAVGLVGLARDRDA